MDKKIMSCNDSVSWKISYFGKNPKIDHSKN